MDILSGKLNVSKKAYKKGRFLIKLVSVGRHAWLEKIPRFIIFPSEVGIIGESQSFSG